MHLFHRWRLVKDTVVWRYEACRVCGTRRVTRMHDGAVQPLNGPWLDGGAWTDDLMGLPPSQPDCVQRGPQIVPSGLMPPCGPARSETME